MIKLTGCNSILKIILHQLGIVINKSELFHARFTNLRRLSLVFIYKTTEKTSQTFAIIQHHMFPNLQCLLFCRFDGRKKRCGSKDKLEKQKLIHKHKREMKGAIREIRKDTQFLARQKLNERIQK